MLAPDSRRTLLDQLRPPDGYRLDAAVGTTFTLDLTAALVPPLAFASFAVRSTTDPVSVLEAVRSCADRVDVFAQEGNVYAPPRYTALTAFLEPMIHEVQAPPGGLFHPKLWMLRFTDDEDQTYRLVVLSRNLTEDHSWDVSLTLDARRDSRPSAANRPLSALIRSLPGRTRQPVPADRRARIEQLAEDVRFLSWERPEDVTEIDFHCYGVAGERPVQGAFLGYRHLVVSPFLNDAGLAAITEGSKDITVVSRPTSLDELAPTTIQTISRGYIVSALAGLDDGDASVDERPAALLSDLHAKLVVVERGQQAHVFVGSANATDAALTRNVEIMVELTGGKKRLGIAAMINPDSPFLSMLEQYDTPGGAAPDSDAESRWKLENALRGLASRGWIVSVTRSGQVYALRLETKEAASLPIGLTGRVEPIAHPGVAIGVEEGRTRHGTIDHVPLLEISPFLRLILTDDRGREAACVARAELHGDPEGRLDEVLASQINTPEKFLRFLALLLGLGGAHPLAKLGSGDGGPANGRGLAPLPQVFELVISALARSPKSIDDLDRLVQRMRATETGAANLPAGFAGFWDVVTVSRARLADLSDR